LEFGFWGFEASVLEFGLWGFGLQNLILGLFLSILGSFKVKTFNSPTRKLNAEFGALLAIFGFWDFGFGLLALVLVLSSVRLLSRALKNRAQEPQLKQLLLKTVASKNSSCF